MSGARASVPAARVLLAAVVVVALGAACSSPQHAPAAPEPDRLLRQAASAGRAAYERGRHADAQAQFRRALDRAEAIDDAGGAADAAYNLALVDIALGDLAAAGPLLERAEYDAARASAALADIRLVRAKLAYLQARPAEAAALADGVLAADVAPHLALQAQVLRGQVAADGGDLAAARRALEAAQALAASQPAGPSLAVEADLRKLEGTIAGGRGDAAAAARAFEAEALLLRAAGRHRDMSHAYARAAAMHLRAGHPGAAADRWFLAARSAAAQGDTDGGRRHAASAAEAARAANDVAALARARTLLDGLSRRDGP